VPGTGGRGKEERGARRSCESFRDRARVEAEQGWPPELLDKLEGFLDKKSVGERDRE